MSASPLRPTDLSRAFSAWALFAGLLVLGACSTTPPRATAPAPRTTAAAANTARNDIALYALSLLDTRYSWGGKGPATGFDCSGLVSHVYKEAAGIKLGGSAVTLGQMSRPIDPELKQPGDLVFFNTLGSRHSHVGVYIGNDRFVHASNPRTGVRVDLLSNRYFAQRFEGVHTLLD
jgi:cell wall-associated NlpC family hydrolase